MVDPQKFNAGPVNRARRAQSLGSRDPRPQRAAQAMLDGRDLDPTTLEVRPNGQIGVKVRPGGNLVRTLEGLAFSAAGEAGTALEPEKADPVELLDLTGTPGTNVTNIHTALGDLIESLRAAGVIQDEE